MGGQGFERRRALEAYSQQIKEHRTDSGKGYDAHERTLLLIGFAAGWDTLCYALDRLSARIHEQD